MPIVMNVYSKSVDHVWGSDQSFASGGDVGRGWRWLVAGGVWGVGIFVGGMLGGGCVGE